MLGEAIEQQWDGDILRLSAPAGTEQFKQLFRDIQIVFPWVVPEEYLAISSPVYNTAFKIATATGTLSNLLTRFIYGEKATCAARKFDLVNKTAYTRHYEIGQEGRSYIETVPSATVLMVGFNHADLPAPPPDNLDIQDIYIKANPDEMEAKFNLEKRRGSYSTFYGISYRGSEILRVKQYVYDVPTPLSDWERAYLNKMRETEPERYARLASVNTPLP